MAVFLGLCCGIPVRSAGIFPDGTPVPAWFDDASAVDVSQLGPRYVITDYGVVRDSTLVLTAAILAVIARAAASVGGVIVVPEGVFLSGSLFFKPGTHLHILAGGRLKGSDDISDFALVMTRIEGQNRRYFAALVNAEGLHGFTMSGEGTVDGNGLRYWKHFWLRREFNPECTNLDEMRPRLVYLSHCRDVRISGLHFRNSPFWTTHLYKCSRVKLIGLDIFAPRRPVQAPSSDAIDIDCCTDMLVKGCTLSVCDDAVALKGGKGPYADRDTLNGGNANIIFDDCFFGFSHSVLSCGSESVHNRNIIVRNSRVTQVLRLLRLKMRPDTPQRYEHILVENVEGDARTFLDINPWTQFFDLQGREDVPMSYGSDITFRNVTLTCQNFLDTAESDQYELARFAFENVSVTTPQTALDTSVIHPSRWVNVRIVRP